MLFAAALLCSAALGYTFGARDDVPETLYASLAPPSSPTAERVSPDHPAGRLAGSRVDVSGSAGEGLTMDGVIVRGARHRGRPSSEGIRPERVESGEPRPDAAAPATDTHPPADPLIPEFGQLRAEILRLRVLFRRLADVAELDDGEFDLGLEPLDLPEVRRAVEGATEGLDLSSRALDSLSRQSSRMARIFDERRAAHGRRVGGRVAPGAVRTSGFGLRPDPFGGRRQLHRGVDYAGPEGSPIHALADGIVTWSGVNGGYGNLVEIEHGDGFRTRYAHNQGNLVALGERVEKGQIIAMLGSSGRSTGAHVHVEVREHGAPLDPAHFVR